MEDNYQIRAGSLEYLPVKVKAFRLGVAHDPTADVVKMALPTINEDPDEPDWVSVSWQTIDDEYFVNALVGPSGDFELDKGDYDILIKITDSPEIPLMRAGRLSII